ncbi:MAG: galactosyldiacylglycerol synthase [Acidobacteria bacterium]|nr:galactosyldiacylglycerol synthase [Acidobacteriota bacterium]
MARIDFIFFDAGGGHRAAANALKLAIEQQGRPWEIRLVNLQETLDRIDIFRQITGLRLQDVYNLLLKKGWTLGSPTLTKLMHLVIRAYHPVSRRILMDLWRSEAPDMIVSLVPNFNRAMFEAIGRVSPSTRYVTVLTDIADYPRHFWIENQKQHFICGSPKAVEQVRRYAHPEARVFETSGMILHPRFYQPVDVDAAAARREMGLDPALPTALVMFGGQGSRVMMTIARQLDRFAGQLQLILICGHNTALATRLRNAGLRIAHHIVGFTHEVPRLMRLCDFFIGKPGPGSVSEAIAMHLPVIVERNAWTLPQERYNADWILERNAGLVLADFRSIGAAVETILAPGALQRYRESVRAIRNRAVFEIPDILERILQEPNP